MDPMEVFRRAVADVPAYPEFLSAQGVDPAAVTDLAQVPLVTKENYLRPYDLPSRCRGGDLAAAGDMVAVSSGSSGRPTVWPRSVADEQAVAARFEQVLVDGFRAAERRTLAVVCFALGNWVGGMYTVAAVRHLAAKGYPVTVAAPGNNVDEILRVVGELGGFFDQVVLLGYPPFVKNVVDTGAARGVDWRAFRIKVVVAGEVFSEQWRDLIAARTSMGDPVTDVAALYGTADAGVLGNETPLSVRIRRFLADRPEVAGPLFGDTRLPTLVQFDPGTRWFETVDGTLVFTADGAVPLVRYHIADNGGVLGRDELVALCRSYGFDPGDGPDLPFVFVFGRSMFTVSFYGANIFPETVAVALERRPIADAVTGRFVLETVEDEDRDRRLSIVVEMAPDVPVDPALTGPIAEAIRAELMRVNSEFAHYVPASRRTPDVRLLPAGDPDWFPAGVKHRYSR
jgi:phenylacetate-CoA ligase